MRNKIRGTEKATTKKKQPEKRKTHARWRKYLSTLNWRRECGSVEYDCLRGWKSTEKEVIIWWSVSVSKTDY